jgi:hypothetical protein
MRLVPECGHRLEHPRPGRLADPAAVIEHVGDGLPAHAGRAGYVLDGYLIGGCGSGLTRNRPGHFFIVQTRPLTADERGVSM